MSKFITLENQKVYLICNGTSTNKVIDSINNNIKSKTSFFSSFFSKKNNKSNIKKINYEEFPKLENIGIKECHICKNNDKNSIILKNNGNFNSVFTSLDYNSIESAMILFSDTPDLIIFPLPYMSDKTNIKNKESFDTFKKKFGEYTINSKYEISSLKEYWSTKMLNSNFINIKNKDQIIDWVYTSNIDKGAFSYKFSLFKKKFEEILTNNYVTIDDISNSVNNIFVCNDKIVVDMLNLFKKVKFDKKKSNIEVTSIWELSIDIKLKINSSNKIIGKEIIYKNYNKFYPFEFNSGTLMKNKSSEKYYYNYNDAKFLLFNSIDNISLEYLKNMTFRENNDLKEDVIKKIISIKNKNKKNKKNKNNTNSINKKNKDDKNKVLNTTSYEKLF